jgi:hypothetical protein
MSAADRGAALETTLLAAARREQQQTLYAVAGPYLVRVERQSDDGRMAEPELIEMPATLGPLRSVQPAVVETHRWLVIGARGGVMLVDSDDAAEVTCFADPELQSAHGFNRAITWRGGAEILASHSEGGLVAWRIGAPDRPRWMVRASELAERLGLAVELPRMGPKNLCAIDGESALLSMGSRVILLAGEEPRLLEAESASEVVDILAAGEVLLIVHADGLVCRLDRHRREMTRRDRYGGAVTAAGVLPWMGSGRLLLACEAAAIDCVGLDDQLVTRYVSSHRGVRMVAASADLVAAVSPDRQRLILWNSWNGRAPAAEVYITGRTKHRVADLAFG